jgi:hypothetical protein
MNVDPFEGIYSDVPEGRASHRLIKRSGSLEEIVIKKNEALPDGWEHEKYLKIERDCGLTEKWCSYELSRAYGHPDMILQELNWRELCPNEATLFDHTTGIGLSTWVHMVPQNTKPLHKKSSLAGQSITLYNQKDLVHCPIKNGRRIDRCYHGANVTASLDVVKIADHVKTVSDHAAIFVTLNLA